MRNTNACKRTLLGGVAVYRPYSWANIAYQMKVEGLRT